MLLSMLCRGSRANMLNLSPGCPIQLFHRDYVIDIFLASFADVLDPSLCPTTPLHIVVDNMGYTRVEPGTPNANVCLSSDCDHFFHFYFHTLLHEHPAH